MATDLPTAWRSARSRNGQNSSVDEMAAEGRQPTFNIKGQIRGFRSRPGAPLSDRDTIGGLGIVPPIGSPDHDAAWKNFFRKTTVPDTTVSQGQPDVFVPPVTQPETPITPESNYSAALDGHTAWMGKNAPTPAPVAAPATGSISTTPLQPGSLQAPQGGISKSVNGLPAGQFAYSTFVPGQNTPWNLAKRRSQFALPPI